MSDEEAAVEVEDDAAAGEGTYTEVTEQGYLENLKQSCSGMVFGVILFVISFVLLVWNEGRTVRRARDIDEGREVILTLNVTQGVMGNESSSRFDQQLVYVTGDLSTTDALSDPIFGVGAPRTTASANNNNNTDTEEDDDTNSTSTTSTPTMAPAVEERNSPLKLQRSVEMYQWIESSTTRKEKTSNGKTRTTTEYSYRRDWSSTLIDSTAFAQPTSERVNPTSFPFDAQTLIADPIFLDESVVLGDPLVDLLNWYEPVDMVSLNDVLDESLVEHLDVYRNNGFFYASPPPNSTSTTTRPSSSSSSPNNPAVGDARVTFTQVPPDTVSVIAAFDSRQTSLDYYVTTGGRNLLLLERGTLTAEEMFQQADSENTTLAWILRFVGFIVMFVSILLVLQPLATAVDIIPLVGDFLQGGMENCLFPAIAFIISMPLSLFTIALAWLAYRPAWSVPILIATTGVMVWLCLRTRNAVQASQGNSHGADGKDDDEEEIAVSMSPQGGKAASGEDESGFAGALDDPAKY